MFSVHASLPSPGTRLLGANQLCFRILVAWAQANGGQAWTENMPYACLKSDIDNRTQVQIPLFQSHIKRKLCCNRMESAPPKRTATTPVTRNQPSSETSRHPKTAVTRRQPSPETSRHPK